ncbi:UNVERIFIED_CONTAM: hypothetical protein K2H54_055235 [Gekko kuhli]
MDTRCHPNISQHDVMASNIMACRNSWLHDWEVDSTTQAQVASVLFKGFSLFGGAMDKSLVEDEDNKKTLPDARKRGQGERLTARDRQRNAQEQE